MRSKPAWEADLFRMLVENTRDYAVFAVDAEGRVLTWNPGAERVLGYAEAEIVGQSSFVTFTPEDRAAGVAQEELRTALREGRAADDRWHVRKDGTRIWVSGVMVLLRDEAGLPRACGKVMRDFTEAKRAQERLRESEERLRVALAAARMGTWLWRIPQDEQVIDETLRTMMGLAPTEQVRTLGDFLRAVRPEDRARVRAEFERCRSEGGAFDVEFRVEGPGGTRWLKDQGRAFPDSGGGPLFITGACVDVTERRRLEDELRRSRDELEERVRERTAELERTQERALQAERLAAIGQTVTALAHEGRNALQRAHSCLARLAMRQEGRPDELGLTARAQQALGDLERLFDDVRAYAAPVRLERRACDLVVVWREAWERLAERRALRVARLEDVAGSVSLSCEADPFRLGQVFLNLFANALDACPDPVVVRVTCSEAELAGRPAGRVSVRDNGPGFPPEHRARLFEPFLTTKPTGTGLGMAICRRIVEAHGGTIEAGAEGPGAEVVITLPRERLAQGGGAAARDS